jgi:hypothetical protein
VRDNKRVFLLLLMVVKGWKRKIVRIMIRVCASRWRVRRRRGRVGRRRRRGRRRSRK